MKLEYVKPDLEELELMLEGSFLDSATKDPDDPDNPGGGKDENEGGDNFGD